MDGLDRLTGFEIIGWGDDGYVVNSAQGGVIVQGVVGGAQSAIAHPRADPDNPDRLVGIGDVVFDLFEATGGDETRRRSGKHFLSGRGQAGRDTDHILFGNAELDNLIRQSLAKLG